MKPKGAKFCTQAPALRVEVTENPDYVMKAEREYGFNITVYTQCFDNKEKLIVEYVEDGKGFRIACIYSCSLIIYFLPLIHVQPNS